jgi:Carboxypeptidase regulatory-like domain
MRGLLFLLLLHVRWSQNIRGPGYRNSDLPNCGSFHTRKIQGTVTAQDGSRMRDVKVEAFDDSSQQFLAGTVTDELGGFSLNQPPGKRYRIVVSKDGFLTQNWAVTVVHGPSGGFFRPKNIDITLPISLGDGMPSCNSYHSK